MSHYPAQRVESAGVEDTLALGQRLGAALAGGDVVALIGTLGSGKTHFVKGVARGADVPQERIVSSPTFVLVHEYPGRLHLHHIDVYRLRDPRELEALGFSEMLASGGVALVEWGDRVSEILPPDHLRVEIAITGPTARTFTFTPTGPRAAELLAEFGKGTSREE
jgi:tRNA threonylcarbamoyladenosine biosynthesis protein TsaE